jgi:chemotaxis protein CheD
VSGAAAARRSADACLEAGFNAPAGRRFYDAAAAAWMVKVFPGEYYATSQANEIVVTVLGSCVAACIRDPVLGVGGMNHFMLANSHSGRWGDDPRSTRFGNFAMEKLINELMSRGCARERLEIKVFGGGNVTDSSNAIGTDNAEFVLRYLEAEGLRCVAQDLGGSYPRRIHYYPSTGRVVRRLLGTNETYAVAREETEYAEGLRSQQTSGEIHLFGNFG